MKNTYVALYLPSGNPELSRRGFKSKAAAEEYVKTNICSQCKKDLERGYTIKNKLEDKEIILNIKYVLSTPCGAEWAIIKEKTLKRCKDILDIFKNMEK